jgi:hypothetical protein
VRRRRSEPGHGGTNRRDLEPIFGEPVRELCNMIEDSFCWHSARGPLQWHRPAVEGSREQAPIARSALPFWESHFWPDLNRSRSVFHDERLC